MSDENSSDDLSFPASIREYIDSICRDFEAAWQAGLRPRVEDYLGESEDAERRELLKQLLLLELDYRSRHDDTPAQEKYHARFPQDRQLISDVFGGLSTDAGAVSYDGDYEPRIERFTPHLSVGQVCGRKRRQELLEELACAWQPVRFRASEVHFIVRDNPPHDVFCVAFTLPLGGDN